MDLGSSQRDTSEPNHTGYLIVGHGTRSRSGQEQVRALFAQMTRRGQHTSLAGAPSELAFLELAEPDIPTAIERLHRAGVQQLVVVPVLLFSAGHAGQDIPEAVARAASQFGMQVARQCSSLCLDPAIVELSAERFFAALAEHTAGANDREFVARNVALALIGRGSSSERATLAMQKFGELRTAMTPVAWSTVGFIHAQRPSVDEALDGLAATGLPWLVVQPHLLFEGELIEELRREVEYRQSFSADQKWIITSTLGTSTSTATQATGNAATSSLAGTVAIAAATPASSGGVMQADPLCTTNDASSLGHDSKLAEALCRLALRPGVSAFEPSRSACPRCHSPEHWCRLVDG